jgi:DNA-binding NtrC family response regulator
LPAAGQEFAGTPASNFKLSRNGFAGVRRVRPSLPLTTPELSGLELSQHVLAIRPSTPIILISGYLHSDALQKAREAGVMSVIKKPFDVKELIARIRTVLNEP